MEAVSFPSVLLSYLGSIFQDLSGKNSHSFTFMVIAESEVFWASSYIEPVLPGLACQSTMLTLEVLLSFHPVLEPLLFIAPAHCVPVHTVGLEGWIFASFSSVLQHTSWLQAA